MVTLQIKSAPFVLVVGLLMAAMGCFLAFHVGKPILDNARASESWPIVPGSITASRVTTTQSDDGTTYGAEILYSYNVDGRDYSGDVVWFGGDYTTSDRSQPQETVNRYQVGTSVDVYHNPEDPIASVLEPGAFFSSYILYGAGLLFFGIGVLPGVGMLAKILLGGLALGYALTKSAPSKTNSDSPDSGTSLDIDDGFIENL